MKPQPAAALVLLLFLCWCADNNPTGPVVPGTEIRYGDTLSAELRYQNVADTAAARGSAIEISLLLRNIAGHEISLDSTSRGTYISVIQDSTNTLMWVWPDVLPSVDTLVRKVLLAKGDSLFFRGRWRQLDFYGRPVAAGRYLFEGYMFGLKAGQTYFQSL